MNLLEQSLQIALNAYAGKKDKAGCTYILHPLRLMARMHTEEEMATALLHDVIEDSAYTPAQLASEGIPASVVEAVEHLTRRDDENYEDFIERAAENELAQKVKQADIEDNLNVLRLRHLKEKDFQRIARYHRAWYRLQNTQSGK